MIGYQAPWWVVLLGALSPPGWAAMFGLGFWVGRRTERRSPSEDGEAIRYYRKGKR